MKRRENDREVKIINIFFTNDLEQCIEYDGSTREMNQRRFYSEIILANHLKAVCSVNQVHYILLINI